MARAAICAPTIPPMVPPAATRGNSRLPSASVMMSFASDQNWAIDSVLKMPSHTKKANPTGAPARPARRKRQASDEQRHDPLDQAVRLDPVREQAVGRDQEDQHAGLQPRA